MKKLCLGCGQYPKEGFINVDIDPLAKADIFHDLSVAPYPFEDNSFAFIEMVHVLEHLPNPMLAMRETWRLLVPRGVLKIAVPHFSRGFTHYDHKRGFDVSFPLYFQKTFKGGYTGIDFELHASRLVWFAQPELKKETLGRLAYYIGLMLGKIFDFLGNISPFATSRLFCFWVGGYEEVYFELRKPAVNER